MDTSGSTDNKMDTTEIQRDFLSDNKIDSTDNKDALSENTREASPNSKSSSKNFQFVDESVQVWDPESMWLRFVFIINNYNGASARGWNFGKFSS